MNPWTRPVTTVDLVRAPSGLTWKPTPQVNNPKDEHQALSTASAIARAPDAAHRIEASQHVSPQPSAGTAEENTRELQSMWGANSERNTAAVLAYVDTLPAAQREEVTTGARANDPALVQELVGRALMPRPADMSIAGIETWMRTNRRDYDANGEVQARYRGLLAERENSKEG